MFRKKPKDKQNSQKIKKRKYLLQLFSFGKKKNNIIEKLVKFLIYCALRLVIKPKRWAKSTKNYELINRVYKKLMSFDFTFIPSSIAFYIIIAFMPIMALILLVTNLPVLQEVFDIENVSSVIGRFIPGFKTIIDGLHSEIQNSATTTIAQVFIASSTTFVVLLSIWIASAGFSQLIYTQSYIYKQKYAGNWFSNRIKGVFLVIAFTLFLMLCLLVNVQVDKLIDKTGISFGLKEFLKYSFLILGLFILLFLSFSGLFKFTPKFYIKYRHVIPGAMVSTLSTTFFFAFFAILAQTFSHYKFYGVISILMYIAFSSLWIAYFLFAGLITNYAYYETHVEVKYLRTKI